MRQDKTVLAISSKVVQVVFEIPSDTTSGDGPTPLNSSCLYKFAHNSGFNVFYAIWKVLIL